MKVIHRREEIPRFQSEADEADFWDTHRLGPKLLDAMRPPPEGIFPATRPRTRPVAIRFDEHVLSRLKIVAQKKGTGYQTLLKEFVTERLYEEERREGLIPAAE